MGTRHDWTKEEVAAIHTQPFPDLMYQAQTTHRAHFSAVKVHRSTLCSIKTGGCPEDCAYCSQSAHNRSNVERQTLLSKEEVLSLARQAKESGSTRFCLASSGSRVKDGHEFDHVLDLIREVNKLGLDCCCTLGMLTLEQARRLKEAGCYGYNHNLDTSPEFYPNIITTRTYADRLKTLENLRRAGVAVCSGGIIGMGEKVEDRLELLRQLANLDPHPDHVPINMLVKIEGTRLTNAAPVDPLDYVRIMATARILMSTSTIHIAAGRTLMSPETQALCFLAGATSIFAGEKLLTTPNPGEDHDQLLLKKLGMEFEATVTGEPAMAGNA